MQKILQSFTSLILFFNIAGFSSVSAEVEILQNRAEINYPESINFNLELSSSEEIVSAELLFGTDVIACGESQSRAIPEDFEPDKEISVEWEWVLRKSGTLPPGTEVWWEWQLTNSSGNLITTPRETLTFIDEEDPWKIYASESLELYYLEGSESFANELANAGEMALDSLYESTGVELEESVRIFIYPTSEAMQTATLFAPDWSGGVAFSDYRTVMAGVAPNNVEWGREVVAHELTHVLIGVYTFSCVGSLPTWLNEGLAMYAEESVGSLHEDEYRRLDAAILNDSLLSIKEISNIFSNDPDLARQAYAQSLTVVEFLSETRGQAKMLEMLNTFANGYPQDQVLTQVYGFDQNSLDAAWRAWIGAPEIEGTPLPETTPTITPFPTIAPITGPSIIATATPREVVDALEATPTLINDTESTVSEESILSDKSFLLKLALIGFLGISTVILFLKNTKSKRK